MKKKSAQIVYTFSKEKIDEFKDMSVKARLQWLEAANHFINKTLGIKKRAEVDERFKIFLKDKKVSILLKEVEHVRRKRA